MRHSVFVMVTLTFVVATAHSLREVHRSHENVRLTPSLRQIKNGWHNAHPLKMLFGYYKRDLNPRRGGLHTAYAIRFTQKKKDRCCEKTELRRTHCIPLRGSRSNCGSFVLIVCLQGNSHTCTSIRFSQKQNRLYRVGLFLRETGLEPVRCEPHAPQTCASASSATLAYFVVTSAVRAIVYHRETYLSTPFFKKNKVF